MNNVPSTSMMRLTGINTAEAASSLENWISSACAYACSAPTSRMALLRSFMDGLSILKKI